MENQTDSKQSDWRRMSTSLLDKLKYVFMNGLMTDLTIRLINGEDITEYKVHKLVFQLASEVFDRMLNSPFKEGLSNVIEIKDVNPDSFQLFLNHLYGQPLIITHTETVIDLLQLADCYLIHSLKEDMINFCKKTETPELTFIGLEVADKYEAPMLREAKLEYISKNTKKVVESTDFLKASLETVKTIMEQDKLSITEIDLFKAVQVWIRHNLAEKGESIKEILMPKLRYSSMSLREFIDGPLASKLLNSDDVVHLMSHLFSRNCPLPMPAGFSEAKRICPYQMTTGTLPTRQWSGTSSHFYVTTNKRIILTHFFISPANNIRLFHLIEGGFLGGIWINYNGHQIANVKEEVNAGKIEIKLSQKLQLNAYEKHEFHIQTKYPSRMVVDLSNQTINCDLSNQTINCENVSFKFEKVNQADLFSPLCSLLFEF